MAETSGENGLGAEPSGGPSGPAAPAGLSGAQTPAERATTPTTTPATERLVSLDFIRGIAVLGILFANITAFAHPMAAYFWPPALAHVPTAGDDAMWVVQLVLVDHKFRGLFTLLFGAGLYLFMERASARGASRWLQVRRLLWLLVFGLIHFFFIWRGDILTMYALWGIIMLLCLRWAAKTQLVVGLIMSILGCFLMMNMLGAQYMLSTNAEIVADAPAEMRDLVNQGPAQIRAEAIAEAQLFTHGSYRDIVADTIKQKAGTVIPEAIFFGIVETFGFMLLGAAFYRYGFFSGALDPAKMRRWGWVGVISGAGVTIPIALWPQSQGFPYAATMLSFEGLVMLPRLAMVVGLAALLAQWAPRGSRGRMGQRFVAAGRMAFSNYIGTSIVMAAIFQGWGLGLYGQFGRLGLLGFVVLGWVLMLAWSKPWLAHFRYGPLEWLWRCLTYWKLLAIRR